MKKKPFVTKEQLDEIIKKYPTPFHLYDEKGIRKNMQLSLIHIWILAAPKLLTSSIFRDV